MRYKAKLPWNTGELAVVTFCDASFAGESGHKSQRGRFHYLTSAKTAADEDAVYHDMHLISYSSSTMKRVCRATSAKRTRCNTPLSMGTESEPQCSRCKVSPHWEEVARRSMLHLQFTDCRSDLYHASLMTSAYLWRSHACGKAYGKTTLRLTSRISRMVTS